MDSKQSTCMITFIVLIILWVIIMATTKCASRYRERRRANQTTDIWNISGRVNHQDGPVVSEPHRWPTHDHHVSIDSFVLPGNLQSQKKDRVPPPPYSEVDLPSYEQATGVPQPKNDIAPVHITPSSSRNFEEARS